MKLGIDFGTTRIVVAQVDRGNFPLVPFEATDRFYDYYPALAAVRNTGNGFDVRYGWGAAGMQNEPGWCVFRSLKRHLKNAAPDTHLLDGQLLVRDLIDGMAKDLYTNLRQWFGDAEPLEVMLGVPANATSGQRFLTMEAFRQAGFTVLGMLNEPSAAAIEYGHRRRTKGRTLVYDLGGGTFDVSLVESERAEDHRDRYTVLHSEGVNQLGGDDFDSILAELALGREDLMSLRLPELYKVMEECQRQKEALHGNSKVIMLDLEPARAGFGQKRIPVAEYYSRCRPLIEKTVQLAEQTANGMEFQTLYVTGGASELPVVNRILAEKFGNKVRRSDHSRSSTAIGLAIQADSASREPLREIFPRHFGVWREAENGKRLIFDPIFLKDTRVPTAGDPPLVIRRRYQPVHNLGHFRFLEAARVAPNGEPAGDITPWDEIFFPFESNAETVSAFSPAAVSRSTAAGGQIIEEEYSCDSAGVVTATMRNCTAGYQREYKLARWKEQALVIVPDIARAVPITKPGMLDFSVGATVIDASELCFQLEPAPPTCGFDNSLTELEHAGQVSAMPPAHRGADSNTASSDVEDVAALSVFLSPEIPPSQLPGDFNNFVVPEPELGDRGATRGLGFLKMSVKAEVPASETFGHEDDLKRVPRKMLHNMVDRGKNSRFITLGLSSFE